jgi:hypothetical protein
MTDQIMHFVIDYLNELTEEEARIVALAKRPKGVKCFITLEAVSCVPSFQVGLMI